MVDCKICGHPYCEHAGTQQGIVVGCSGYMPKPKPKTNADRIRAMSDEELAKFLERASIAGCPEPARSCWANCVDCIEDWLRQPVKDGDNE